MLLAAVPVALVLIGYVWVNLELLRSGYRIHELEGRLQEQRRALSLLELEEAYLTSAARLADRGAELGLAAPAAGRLIHVKAGHPPGDAGARGVTP